MNKAVTQAAITLAGAIAGGILGHVIFLYLARNYGAIGYAIPGVAVGLGAAAGRSPLKWIAIVCGAIGLFAGLFSAWKVMPFVADRSFTYFVAHAHKLQPLPMILIALGGLIAFWIPFRRRPRGRSAEKSA